jgi:DNA recombination protein RmuC
MPAPTLLAFAAAVAGAALVAVFFLLRQNRLSADAARLDAELRGARQSLDEQRAALAETQGRLRDTFAALSRDALKDNRTDFLQHAGDLLAPVRETLDRVQRQLGEVDKAREGSFRDVASQLVSLTRTQEQLHTATTDLTRSLRSPNVRGKWGEVQLRRIVELSGMIEQCDFTEKATVTTSAGARQIPDLIVHLPGNGSVVVDAKVPIDAYLLATDAKTESERQDLLAAHTRQVKDHIRTLGAKDYWKQFQPAPEFVVMFLPLEPLLACAFEQDGSLLDLATSQRVIPATPMTLLALLKAIAFGWQQQAVAKNAEEIQLLGRDLYERISTLVEHLEAVGRNISQAADSYNRFVGSLEQKVLPAARRFKELGVSSTKDIDLADQIDVSLRKVTREELVGVTDEAARRYAPPN